MPANPERMRPTEASKAEIVKEANIFIGEVALKWLEELQAKKDEEGIRRIRRFLANTAGEPKEPKGGQQ